MRAVVHAVVLTLAVAAVEVRAADVASSHVVIPVVGRTPGAAGSVWRTDVVISNIRRNSAEPVQALLTLMLPDGTLTRIVPVHSGQTLVLEDVIDKTFGLGEGSGLLTISAASPDAGLIARARIYNAGGDHGEFGQGVPGLPADALTNEHWLTGLTGVDGNRTNVGISNPWNVDANVTVGLIEPSGNELGSFTTTIPARSVRQYNDIFATFADRIREGSIRITSSLGLYTYASIVRADSGDATFVTGSGFAQGNAFLLTPACSNPAPASLAPRGSQSANSWIVMFFDGVNATAVSNELAQSLGFTPTLIYENAFKGFSAELSQQMIASIRCDPRVRVLVENVVIPIP